jgi:AcrR family transcriptional regulator
MMRELPRWVYQRGFPIRLNHGTIPTDMSQVGKRELQRLATLENIRSTVDQLVDEFGFDRMTIRQICSRAGITIGAFYHHFKSKDELLYDRYTRSTFYTDQLDRETFQALPPLDALKHFVKHNQEYIKTRVRAMGIPYHKALVTEYQNWSRRQEDLSRTILLRHFKRGQDLGQIKTTRSAEELAYACWCFLLGIRYAECMEEGALYIKYHAHEQVIDWLDSLGTQGQP